MTSTTKRAGSSPKQPSSSKKLKAKTKGKKVVSQQNVSKSSVKGKTRVSHPQYDPTRFRSVRHCRAFEDNFASRPVLIEKKFEVIPELLKTREKGAAESFKVSVEIREEILMRHWGFLCKINFPAFTELVAEFYANANLPKDPEPYKSFVRGRDVSFDPEVINSLLRIPKDGRQCQFDAPLSRYITDVDSVEKVLCEGKGAWLKGKFSSRGPTSLSTQSLSLKAKLWWFLVHGILLPIQHKTSITNKRLKFLEVLMKKKFINVGLAIAKEIHYLRGRKKVSLAYASIISQLCVEAGVPTEGLIPMRKSKPMDLSWVIGVGKLKELPDESKASTPRGKTSDASSSSLSKEDKILHRLEVIQENLRRLHESNKVAVLIEPLLRAVGKDLRLDVDSLLPMKQLDEDFIQNLMKFEEFEDEDHDEEKEEEEDNKDEVIEVGDDESDDGDDDSGDHQFSLM